MLAPSATLLLVLVLAATAVVVAADTTTTTTTLRGTQATTGGGKAKGGGKAGGGGGVIFVDAFDKHPVGQAPPAPWDTTVSKGAVTVEEFKPGVKALKATTQAADGGKTAYATLTNLTLPAGQNKYFGRLRFYLESAPADKVHWTMVQGSGPVIDQDFRGACRFGGQLPVGGGSQLMANYDTPDFYGGKGPGTDCWKQGNGAIVPVQKWTCLEWLFDGTAPAAVGMQFWLDGQEVEALSVAGGKATDCVHQNGATYVLPSPDFAARVDVGWESYNADKEPRTLWIDDVALGTERVGC